MSERILIELNLSQAKIFGLLLVFLFLAVSIQPLWHTQKFYPPIFIGTSLESFDKIVEEGQVVCFSYKVFTREATEKKEILLSAITNDKVVLEKNFILEKDPIFGEGCFSSDNLVLGENKIDVFIDRTKLFFNVKKIENFLEKKPPKLDLLDASASAISFSLEQGELRRVEPINIFVNGELYKKIFSLKEKEAFSISPELKEGENKIVISYQGQQLNTTVFKEPVFKMNFVIGIILLLMSVFVFGLFVFVNGGFVERLSLSFGAIFSIIIVLIFGLNYAVLLSNVSFAVSFIFIVLAIGIAFRKNYKPLKNGFSFSKISSIEVFAFIVFVSIVLLFNIFSFNYMSYWTPYYERQTEAILAQESIPIVDEFSYLGKGYTFIPGYFLLEAGLSWLTGLRGPQLIGLGIALSNLLFILALFYMGKGYGFSTKKNALFYGFLVFSAFILTFFVLSPRHTFAFAFFILALAVLLNKKNFWVSGVFLAISGFIQGPMLLAFPLFYLFYSKKVEWKYFIKALLVGTVLFTFLFLPNILLYGTLTQAQSSSWGYLINVTPLGLYGDIGPMIIFFLLFFAIDLFKEGFKFDGFTKKLTIVFFIGIAFQIFVSYRWNIFVALGLAILLVKLFPENFFKNLHAERILAILALIYFGMVFTGMFLNTANDLTLQPMSFLSEHSSSNDVVLTDPLFGHSITYYTRTKVVADLAVEYVDEKKLEDSFLFLKNKDYLILEKYNVKFIVNQSDLINEKAHSNERLVSPLEFEKLDKIYSNEFMYIHLNTQENTYR